jgi:hypothetical protein
MPPSYFAPTGIACYDYDAQLTCNKRSVNFTYTTYTQTRNVRCLDFTSIIYYAYRFLLTRLLR